MAVAHMPSGLSYQNHGSLSLHQVGIRESAPRFLLLNGIMRSISTRDIRKKLLQRALGNPLSLKCLHENLFDLKVNTAAATVVSELQKQTKTLSISASIELQKQNNHRKPVVKRLSLPHGRELRPQPWSISAIGSGLEAISTDPKKNDISFRDAKIVVESRDDEKIHVRVDLTGDETQRAFDEILVNLACTAPPMPGFRKMKGGRTSNVPKSLVLRILGQDRVTKFLIQEIVSTTVRAFVTKENLKVKSEINTIQTAEELESSFSPGKEFGFNATLEIEKPEPEISSPNSS